MGACVSVHKDPDSLMKLRLSIGSKNEKLLIQSPVKEKQVTVNTGDPTAVNVAFSSMRSPARNTSLGSKDEAFFDSQPWLESDCEDDFLSVNGDFTPSRGNTPVHPNSTLGKLVVVNKMGVEEGSGSNSMVGEGDKKKRLSELFQESSLDVEYNHEESPVMVAVTTTLAEQLKSTNGTPFFSRANSDGAEEEDRPLRSPQCCMPKMLSSRSFNDRKRRSSPAPSNLG